MMNYELRVARACRGGLGATRVGGVSPQLQVPNWGSLNTEREPGNEPPASSIVTYPYVLGRR